MSRRHVARSDLVKMSSIPAYVPGFVCTLKTCSVKVWGFVHYQPNLPANILFMVIFAALFVAQIILGRRYRTTTVMVAMACGLGSEVAGYIARVMIHIDPFVEPYFLWYLICLTIGPAFLSAGIYVTLGKVVVVYGEKISRIRPGTYTVIFMGCDLFSLVLQALGGGIAASVPFFDTKTVNLGTHILVAGLSIQVASLFFFSCASLEFFWRVHKNPSLRSQENMDIANSTRFKWFLRALGLATVLLFVRTFFRAIELSQGFGGKPANNEIEFMVLDGTMVIIASTLLTILHPGIGLGDWNRLAFTFFKPKPPQKPKVYARTREERLARLAALRETPRDVEKTATSSEIVHEEKTATSSEIVHENSVKAEENGHSENTEISG